MTGNLTERQLQVLRLKAEGLTNKEIAHRLGLSPITIKNHTSFAYSALGAMCLAEALTALGWLRLPEEAVA